MHKSHIPLRKWAIAIYLHLTSLKGVSSMKLHRDIGVSQPTAWYMLQPIRKAWESKEPLFAGPLEVDETYLGGKESNKHESKKLKAGRGTVGKATVIGAKDRKTKKVRAKVIKGTNAKTLQGFVLASALTARPSTRMMRKGIVACPSSMKPSSTPSASTCASRRIRTASSHFGPCSGVGTTALTTT